MNHDQANGMLSRREILSALSRLAIWVSAASVISEGLPERVLADDETKATDLIFAFGDEGRWPTNSSYTIGFLLAQRPDQHRQHLMNLRENHRYKRTLTYNSTDKYKVAYASDVMKYFFERSDLRYVAKVVGVSKNSEKLHYKDIVSQFAPLSSKISLSLKANGRIDGRRDVRNYLAREVSRIDGIKLARMKEDDLMQLADFFTGNIALECARSKGDDRASDHKVKIRLLQAMHEHLGVNSLLDNSLRTGDKFRVWSA